MRFHLLVGVTGSVAAIKLGELVGELTRAAPANRLLVRVVATEPATRFFAAADFPFPVYRDDDEWAAWKGRGDPVLHIELRKWADLLLIAPLDANTLAKVANGLADNLLTCIVCPALLALVNNGWMVSGGAGAGVGSEEAALLRPRHEHLHAGAPADLQAARGPQGPPQLQGSPLSFISFHCFLPQLPSLFRSRVWRRS